MLEARDHWLRAYSYIETCRCQEWMRTGSCGCVSRRGRFKGINPCQRTTEVLEDIYAMSMGCPSPHGNGPQEVIDYILTRSCHEYRAGGCKHWKCNQATEVLQFLRGLLHRKAA